MAEQERASALADAVRDTADGYMLTDGGFAIYFNKAEWSTIEAALRLLAATPAATPGVTDEMVNRAFCVACCGPLVGASDGQTYELRTPTMQTMRAALEAALRVKETPDD